MKEWSFPYFYEKLLKNLILIYQNTAAPASGLTPALRRGNTVLPPSPTYQQILKECSQNILMGVGSALIKLLLLM